MTYEEPTQHDLVQLIAPTNEALMADGFGTQEPKAKTWICFHCAETFYTRTAAAQHFGADQLAQPACKIKGVSELHLVAHIRELEKQLAEYRLEDDRITRAWEAKHYEHVDELRREKMRAEELGYSRGLRDGRLTEISVVINGERMTAAEAVSRGDITVEQAFNPGIPAGSKEGSKNVLNPVPEPK